MFSIKTGILSWRLSMLVMLILLCCSLFAHGAGNIGFNFSQVIDDQSAGLFGEYEYDGEGVGFEIDGQLQSGDVYRGKTHAEITFYVSAVGIKLLSDTTAKGYTLDTLGRDSNVAVALTVPAGDLNFDVGIGGKQASPWGAPNALSELVPKGYDQTELEALGLDKVTPAPRGLPFQEGAFLQTYIATGFKRGGVDIDIKGIIQLTGEEKAHQVLTSFDTSRNIGGNFTLNIGAEVGVMSYQKSIHSEVAIFTGLGYKW